VKGAATVAVPVIVGLLLMTVAGIVPGVSNDEVKPVKGQLTWKATELKFENTLLGLFNINPAKTIGFKGYNETKHEIDQVLDTANLKISRDQIVGIREYGALSILLVDQKEKVLEVVRVGDNMWTYSLTPKLLGSEEYPPVSVENRGKYTIYMRKGVKLQELEIKVPAEVFREGRAEYAYSASATYDVSTTAYDVGTTYIVTAWMEPYWEGPGGKNLLHVEGKFWVDYGAEVYHVTNNSYTETSSICSLCKFTKSEEGLAQKLVKSIAMPCGRPSGALTQPR